MNCRPSQLVFARTNTTGRLVQGHVNLPFDANRLAVHRHFVVVGIDLGPEPANRLAVDADAPGLNDLFSRAARSHAGISQKLLKANHGKLRISDLTLAFTVFNPQSEIKSNFRFGFTEAGDAVAVLPLAAFFEKRGALETFEDIALAAENGRCAQTAML